MNNDYSTQHIEQSWEGQPKVKGPKWLHKPLLTLSLLGELIALLYVRTN